MSLRTLLLVRSGVALVGVALGIYFFADGNTFFGLLWLAFGITNAVLIFTVNRRNQ